MAFERLNAILIVRGRKIDMIDPLLYFA